MATPIASQESITQVVGTWTSVYLADVYVNSVSNVLLGELGIVQQGMLPPMYVRPKLFYRVVFDHPAVSLYRSYTGLMPCY